MGSPADDMPRFYLTTAIDYVNSRPHLGTAYEKVAADVIARYKRLAGFDTHFVMGNDEHSQNVFRKARELGEEPAGLLRSDGAGVHGRLAPAGRVVRRLHPDDGAAAQGGRAGARPPDDGCRRHLRRASTKGGTAFRARPSSRRRISSTASVRFIAPSLTGFGRRTTSSGSRATAIRCWRISQVIPEFLVPEIRRNEILRLLEAGLDDISVSRAGQSWGIPMPQDPASVDLRLGRRAHQLRQRGGLRHRSRRWSRNGGRPTCTSSARTSRGSTR